MCILLLFLFFTISAPGAIENFTEGVDQNGDIVLTWDPPVERGGPKLRYRIDFGDKYEDLLNPTYTLLREDEQRTVAYKVLYYLERSKVKLQYFMGKAIEISMTSSEHYLF